MNAPENSKERPRARGWLAAVLFVIATISSLVVGLLVNFVASDASWASWLGTVSQASTVLGLLVGVAVVMVVSFARWPIRAQRRSERGGRGELAAESAVDARIEEATRALRVTAGLVNELQVEMQARMAALDRLRAENDEFEKLAAVRKKEAEAVSRLIENVIDSTHSKLSRSSRRDQGLFFVAGLVASIPVQILVNWLG